MKLLFIFLSFTTILYSQSLKLNINPLGCNITINNKIYSKPNNKNILNLEIKNGEYNIKICKENYECYKNKIWIMDKDLNFNINLTPIKSTLVITSNNSNSEVYINNHKIQKGDIQEFIKEQTIEIREKKDFFNETKMKFKINLGKTYHLNLPKLKPIKKSIIINGKIGNPSIRLNGKEICKKSCKKSIKSGRYNLSIIKDGYFPYEKEIKITNKDLNINYKLIKKPKNLNFGLGLSYLYGRLLGGYPELNLYLKLKNKINIKLNLIYVVNFSNESEYYGLVLGGSYDVFKYKSILNLYIGANLIFSKYIDNQIDYLENGLGINIGTNYKIIKNLYIHLEFINRLHYMYESKFYDILGKLGLVYYF